MKYALIGCGRIATNHIKAVLNNHLELSAVCDVKPEAMEALLAKHGLEQDASIRRYTDYKEMVETEKPTLVGIATESGIHAEIALYCIAHGVNVIIEKPMAMSMADADAIVEAAQRNHVKVCACHQNRFNPAVQATRKALEEGRFGKLSHGSIHVRWNRNKGYYDQAPWRGTWAMDGGALMNQGIHGVDLVRYLMGPADSIYALSGTLVRDIEVEDTLTAVVAWHCGAQGVIQASVGDYPGFPRRIELNGESGTIILEEDRIVKWEVAGDSAYHIYEQEPAPEVRSHSEAGAIDPLGHVAQLRNFIDAVRGEGTLLVDEAEGRKALALVLAAIGWVQVNMGALYAARDVDTVGILRAGGAAAAGAALLALLYWKIRRDPIKKKIFLGAIAAVVVLAIPVGLYKLTHMWGGLTPEQLVGSIQENGDSIYTYSAGYICRNLPNTAKLLLRSFSAQGAQWVQGVLGTALGEPIVYTVDASWVLGVGFILALLAAALPQAGETVPLGRRTKAGVWGIILCVIALSFVTALNWTPINYTTIFGLQGRYWLPVLPLVLALVHHNRTFAVQKPAERKAVFAMLCLTSFVILQGAGLYATFQMPS